MYTYSQIKMRPIKLFYCIIVLCLLMVAVSFFVKYLTPAKLDGGSNRIGMPYMPDMGGSKRSSSFANEGVIPHRSSPTVHSERLPVNRKPLSTQKSESCSTFKTEEITASRSH